MDTVEFEKLINTLDLQLTGARRDAERKAKKEALERKWKQVSGQRQGLEQRLEDFAKLGAKPGFDIDTLILKLKEEEADLERQIAELTAQLSSASVAPAAAPVLPRPPEPAPAIDPALRMRVGELIGDIRDARLDDSSPDERWALFHVWALRWRVLAETIGQEIARDDRDMKAAYALIKQSMERYPDGQFFIYALHKGETADWEKQLEVARLKLQRLMERRRHRQEAERDFEELKAVPVRHVLPEDPEGVRLLVDLSMRVARDLSFRDDLAEFLQPYRSHVGRELQFLWEDEETVDTGPVKVRLSNRRILERILRRMLSRSQIGECHGPLDRVYRAFPEHEQGRVKEALDVLIRSGMIREKSNASGRRISLDGTWAAGAEAFVAGRPSGSRLVDEWCEKESEPRPV